MEQKGHRAKKSFGQHFLKDMRVLKVIVEASNISAEMPVLEIGPGKGALTKKLLEAGARVIAVEKDHDLIPVLSEKFKNEIEIKQLTLIEADIMEWLMSQKLLQNNAFKVVANIPYNITGGLIEILLSGDKKPVSMTLLIQKEVAERIVSRDKKGSILTWAVRYYGIPRYIKTVSKTAFSPAPKVASAVITIENIQQNTRITDSRAFFLLLHTAFGHKRKQLKKNLKAAYSETTINEAWKKLSLPETIRAEDLSWEEIMSLGEVLSPMI